MSDTVPPPINPYQSPDLANALAPGSVTGDYFRDGKFLVFRDRAELPMRCLISGEAVTAEDWRKRKQLSWNPPWIFIGILGGLLPILILMLVVQKKAHLVYSLGKRARSRIRNRQLLGTGLLVAFAVILMAGISKSESGSNSTSGFLMMASVLALIAGLVFLIIASPVKAVGHRKGWFKVKGVSQDLLDEFPQGDWKSL
ncbi:MAG: hypothetical protein EOP87_19255 [Verrucomicrobiaceae bacterium]|nr:MAG: hypothetical protein EOP87_19255 [Verrucomicrobiaceae bacterium]